jgi:DNA-binding transcriptional LysR family regulator
MDLRQIEYFVAVAEGQHFTHAAQRLHIAQSALSTSIRGLEAELGSELFIRSTRKVVLTSAGRIFLDEARHVLSAVRQARAAMSEVQGLKRGTLSIGAVQTLAPFVDLPALLASFHALHPAVEIKLCQGGSVHLLDKIQNGRLDLAFVTVFEPLAETLTVRELACEPLVALCSRAHRLAARGDVTLAELAAETFVDFQPDWGIRRLVDNAFAAARVKRTTGFEVSDMLSLLSLVERGLGVALLPERVATAQGTGGLAFARLRPPEVCWELAVVFPGRNGLASAPAAAFLELMQGRQATNLVAKTELLYLAAEEK